MLVRRSRCKQEEIFTLELILVGFEIRWYLRTYKKINDRDDVQRTYWEYVE